LLFSFVISMTRAACDEDPRTEKERRTEGIKKMKKLLIPFSRSQRGRAIIYWTLTLPVAFENTAGAMWVFAPLLPGIKHLHSSAVFAEYLHLMLAHLGYPQYFKFILGPWQLACAAVLVAPRLPRAKEWAYIGAFFNYSSAFLSHFFAGDRPEIGAAVLAAFTIISWALRPSDRGLLESAPVRNVPAMPWISAACILLLLLTLSFLWLPKLPVP
jgi:hypothetical protein